MNSERTQIARRSITAPTRWLLDNVKPVGQRILHFGEGKALLDTAAFAEYNWVWVYDPNGRAEARHPWVLDLTYDIVVSNYVFNTLTPGDRLSVFNSMPKAPVSYIAVRTDKVKGELLLGYDGVVTKRGTYQAQLNRREWANWFSWASNYEAKVSIMHNGGHYCIIKVEYV